MKPPTMSTPEWVRRLSNASDSLCEFGLPSVSLYKPELTDSKTSLESSTYMSRSIGNVSDGRNADTSSRNRQREDRNRSPHHNGYHGDVESHGVDGARYGRREDADRFKKEKEKNSENERRKRSGNPMASTSDSKYDNRLNNMHAQNENRGVSSSQLSGRDSKLDDSGLKQKGYSDSKLQVHEGERYVKKGNKREPKREDSWSYVDSDDLSHTSTSLHTSASYGDFEAKSSTVSGSSYMRGNRSEQDRKRKRRPRDDDTRTSSGYNSYSELSEFANTSRSSQQRKSANSLKSNDKYHSDVGDDKISRFPRISSAGRLDESDRKQFSRPSSQSRMSPSKNIQHARSDSKLSMSESEPSKDSRCDKKKKTADRSSSNKFSNKGKKATPMIGNVAVTVNNNVNYDPNDPFYFIQPVEIPFYAKIRKCIGPIAAVLLLVILAGALGAAIYFASALKETQAKEIDILRANLAVKIRFINSIENIDDLSDSQLKDLSTDHCSQMDRLYTASSFQNTYRGCEVVFIKNNSINFTLFFAEKDASSTQIFGVIEKSADKKPDAKTELAVVGKLELVLNDVEIKMDRRMEPETFDKKTMNIVTTTTTLKPTDGAKPGTPPPTAQATPVAPPIGTTPAPVGKLKPQPTDLRVYSWDPCASYEGSYFPHPTECTQYFQCSNGVSVLQNCTVGLLYHWKQLTCVTRFMKDVECPDASKAPPKPTTTTTTTTATTTTTTQRTPNPTVTANFFTGPSTMDPFLADFSVNHGATSERPMSNGVILTALAAQSQYRPKYPMTPCTSKEDTKLYPHPKDCAKFIQCVNGKVQILNCSRGLVFETSSNSCILPPNKQLLCPDIKPCATIEQGYFIHPYDCSKFIQCDRNKEIVRSCPPGFNWNEEINACLTQTPKRKCYNNLPE